MSDRAAELAYLEGVRALAEQQSSLESARARVGSSFAVAAAATGFVAPAALTGHAGMPGLGWVAIGSLLSATTCAFMVVWPRGKWTWTNKPRDLAGAAWSGRDEAEVNRLIAGFIGGHLDRNEAKLERIWRWVRGTIVLTALSVVAWVLLLAGVWS